MRLRTWTVTGATIVVVLACAPSAVASTVHGDFDANGKDDVAIGVPGEKVDGLSDAGAVNVIYGSGNGLSAGGGPGDELFTRSSPDVAGDPEAFADFGSALVVGDFNGDGADDLAAAAPDEEVADQFLAGSVTVLYGDAGSGLSGAGSQEFSQATDGLGDEPEESDRLGVALAAGDFDADGRDDLAIGSEETFAEKSEGAVNLVYGGDSGLSGTAGPSLRFLHQDVSGVNESTSFDDFFGAALTSADLNGDGPEDLAIGVPGEGFGAVTFMGIVQVIYGSDDAGLDPSGSPPDEIIQQGANGYEGVADVNDKFGRSLTSGDFNGDGFFDLGIGTSDDVGSTAFNAGALSVVFGSDPGGVSATAGPGDQLIHQDSTLMPSNAATNETFTDSLVAADFDGDGFDDIAVGNPDDPADLQRDAGSVTTIYGDGTAGLDPAGPPIAEIFNQGINGVEQTAEEADRLGTSVTAGDFNGDDEDDLLIGASGEDLGAHSSTDGDGVAHAIYGDPTNGIDATNPTKDKLFHQGVKDIEGEATKHDRFGFALAAPARGE